MRIVTLLLLTNISLIFNLTAQNYEPLRSKEQLPNDFTISPITKYENLVGGISNKARKSGRATEERFYLKSSFVIDELLKSGKVLFNDPITKYISEVADELLAHDTKLRDELRFYAVRSPSVNAFATHEGIIFVNLGLIARLENEAQLAFILAHEIVHYKEKHALNLFANTVRNAQVNGLIRSGVLEQELLSKQQFSQELEIDADEKGLELFLQSEYNPNDLGELFDVLAHSHLPAGDVVFSKSFFETQTLKFPNRFFLSKIKPRSQVTKTASSGSHPELSNRKAAINKHVKNLSGDKSNFLIGAPMFFRLREKAQYELSYLYLHERNYYNSIYNAYLLLQDGKNSLYLKKCIAKALQAFVYFKNSKNTHKVEIHHNYITGEIQQLYYFINMLKNDQLNVLALVYAWDLYKENTNDEELKAMVIGLFQQMVNHHYDKMDDFYRQAPNFDGSVVTANLKEIDDNSHWEKEFIKYAFVAYLRDPEFVRFFQDSKKNKFILSQQKAFANSLKGRSIQKHKSRKQKEEGLALGINRVVLVNPHYVKFDSRKVKGNQKLFIESESARNSFRKKLWKNAKLAKLGVDILDVKDLKSPDISKYNDIVTLNDWFDQQLEFDFFDMPSFNQAEVDKIAKKYRTDYFVWMGVINKREKKNILNSISEFYMPYNSLYGMIAPNYESLFFAVVYDVKNYELKMVKIELIKQRDSNSIINAHIYDTFLQIKQRPN